MLCGWISCQNDHHWCTYVFVSFVIVQKKYKINLYFFGTSVCAYTYVHTCTVEYGVRMYIRVCKQYVRMYFHMHLNLFIYSTVEPLIVDSSKYGHSMI